MSATMTAELPWTTLDARARQAWETHLDRLELDLMRAERHLASGRELRVDRWDRPGTPGALPRDMVPRAQALLERQRVVMEALAASLGETARQALLARTVSEATARGTAPVYVDVAV